MTLSHVAIRANDFDRTFAFYRDILGFHETLRYTYADGSTLCSLLRIDDSHCIELFANGTGRRAPGRFDTAIVHFCLVVPDVDAAERRLADHSVPVTRELLTAEGRIILIEDPDGNTIELVGPATAAHYDEAARAALQGHGPRVIATDGMPPAASVTTGA